MGNVVLDMTMSLDGFIAGPNNEDRGLHDWWFSPSDRDRDVIAQLVAATGAVLMGRRTYDLGDREDGFVDNPFEVPHFVLSHGCPARPARGGTRFTFVPDGIHRAIDRAAAAAGDKDVVVAGGASTAQQCIKAGLIDEMRISLAPVLLGQGIRLFDRLTAGQIELASNPPMAKEIAGAQGSSGVTHLRYRLPTKGPA